MADWVVCPSCLLNHTRRADGKCPKCGTALDAVTVTPQVGAVEAPAVPAPPAVALPPPPVFKLERGVMEDDDVPLGAKIGAGLMLVNAVLLTAELGLIRKAGQPSPVIAIIIDVWIGISLLRGKENFLPWARWRIVLGALIFTALHASTGDWMTAAAQVLLSAGLLALFLGRPGRVRIAAGITMAGLCLVGEMYGLVIHASGRDPAAALLQAGRFEPAAVDVLKGRLVGYEIRCPSKWRIVRQDVVAKENPGVDRWISKPDLDAHVYVIVERLPAAPDLDMALFEEAYLDQAKTHMKELEVLPAPTIGWNAGNSRFVHTRGKVDSIEVESYAGLFEDNGDVAQVVAICPRGRFGEMEGEFRKILASFAFPQGRPAESVAGRRLGVRSTLYT